MDTNLTPYFLLNDETGFATTSTGVRWDPARGALVLAQQQRLRLPSAATAALQAAWDASSPVVLDRHGQVGTVQNDELHYSDGTTLRLLHDADSQPVRAPAGEFVDLGAGGDGLLAAPYSNAATGGLTHGVLLFKLGARWQSSASLPAAPVRATVDAAGRVWCISASTLYLLLGAPLPHPYNPEGERFEPHDINPRAFALQWQRDLPAPYQALALAVDEDYVYILCTDPGEAESRFVLRRALVDMADRPFDAAMQIPGLADAGLPPSLDVGVIAPGLLALPGLADNAAPDCGVVQISAPTAPAAIPTLSVLMERYPMRDQAAPRLVASLDGKPRYQGAHAGPTTRPRALKRLPKPAYPSSRAARLSRRLEAGNRDTVWHRLFVDACIPAGCEVTVTVIEASGARLPQPPLLLASAPSELPYYNGAAEDSSLYEVLLQRADGNVRHVLGSSLEIELSLGSDGRHTPAIHALRVYYPRFSYLEAYLPEYLRQEQRFATSGPANGADVRERLLAAFEGVLTPLEGRVAEAEQLFHPRTAPAAQLANIAAALGARQPAAWPEARRRDQLTVTGLLQKQHGTLAGLRLALDVATDGGVDRGAVVVVENFRLRRTMATLLGIDMDDSEHPLTLGTQLSGNSIIGGALVLSDEDAREFIALFAPELASEDLREGESASERARVEAFFDRYAHQVTVLVHASAQAHMAAIENTLTVEMPAHVQYRVLATEHPFVLGLAPLLAIDTWLEEPLTPRRVTLGDTYLGREGLLINHQAFSPLAVNRTQSDRSQT